MKDAKENLSTTTFHKITLGKTCKIPSFVCLWILWVWVKNERKFLVIEVFSLTHSLENLFYKLLCSTWYPFLWTDNFHYVNFIHLGFLFLKRKIFRRTSFFMLFCLPVKALQSTILNIKNGKIIFSRMSFEGFSSLLLVFLGNANFCLLSVYTCFLRE